MKPPFIELKINKASSGFYEGYSLPVVLASTAIMVILVLWALVLPSNASSVLSSVNSTLLNGLNGFYIKTVGFFALFLLGFP
jgi:choline-glycine betaine transporter